MLPLLLLLLAATAAAAAELLMLLLLLLHGTTRSWHHGHLGALVVAQTKLYKHCHPWIQAGQAETWSPAIPLSARPQHTLPLAWLPLASPCVHGCRLLTPCPCLHGPCFCDLPMLPRLWAQFQVPFIIETIHGEDVAIGTWIGRASKHHAEVCMVHCAFVKRVHRQVVVDHVACLHGLFRRLRRFRRPRLLRRCPALLCRLFKRIRCLRLLRHLRLFRRCNHRFIDALVLSFWCLKRRSHLITEASLARFW